MGGGCNELKASGTHYMSKTSCVFLNSGGWGGEPIVSPFFSSLFSNGKFFSQFYHLPFSPVMVTQNTFLKTYFHIWLFWATLAPYICIIYLDMAASLPANKIEFMAINGKKYKFSWLYRWNHSDSNLLCKLPDWKLLNKKTQRWNSVINAYIEN